MKLFLAAWIFILTFGYAGTAWGETFEIDGVPINFTIPKGYVKPDPDFFSAESLENINAPLAANGNILVGTYLSETDKKRLLAGEEGLTDFFVIYYPADWAKSITSHKQFQAEKPGFASQTESVLKPQVDAYYGVISESDTSMTVQYLYTAPLPEGDDNPPYVQLVTMTVVNSSGKEFILSHYQKMENQDREALTRRTLDLLNETGFISYPGLLQKILPFLGMVIVTIFLFRYLNLKRKNKQHLGPVT